MKNFCLGFFVVASGFLSAQRNVGQAIHSTPKNTLNYFGSRNNILCDTSAHVFFGNDSAVCYPNSGTGNWGFISGTNNYKDISKAEKFFASDYSPGYQLAGGIFYFFSASDGTVPTTMKLSAWDDDGNGGYPKTELASTPVQFSSFNDSSYTALFFTNPVPVSGDFYLGLDAFSYSSPQDDTLALFTTEQAPFLNTAYERWIDSTWHAFDEPNNWNLKSGFFIAAILCNTDVGSYEIINPSPQLLVFPNPNSGSFALNAGKSVSGRIQMELINAMGKVVYQTELFSDSENYQVTVPDNVSGVYQLRIHSERGTRSTRILLR